MKLEYVEHEIRHREDGGIVTASVLGDDPHINLVCSRCGTIWFSKGIEDNDQQLFSGLEKGERLVFGEGGSPEPPDDPIRATLAGLEKYDRWLIAVALKHVLPDGVVDWAVFEKGITNKKWRAKADKYRARAAEILAALESIEEGK